MEEHFSPYKKSRSQAKFAVDPHCCAISQSCCNTLIQLSEEMDDGASCITRGAESRISKHHLDKFVNLAGRSVPPTHKMTEEEKQMQIVKSEEFKTCI